MKKQSGNILLLCCLQLLAPLLSAEISGQDTPLKLTPSPKEVRVRAGSFHVKSTTRILVEFGHQAEDRIAAETLAEEIQTQSGLKLAISGAKPDSRHEAKEEVSNIVLARLQDRKVRSFLESKSLRPNSIGEQGYLLFADDSHLIVAANTGQGLFYGVQTLRQLLRPDKDGLICPAVLIRDWPSIEWRGVSDDLSGSLIAPENP